MSVGYTAVDGWNILFISLSLTEGEAHYPFFEKCVPVPHSSFGD